MGIINLTKIYKSRNFLKLLGNGRAARDDSIYKSRNFLKLLGIDTAAAVEQIYKSRNFLKLLGANMTSNELKISTRVEIF